MKYTPWLRLGQIIPIPTYNWVCLTQKISGRGVTLVTSLKFFEPSNFQSVIFHFLWKPDPSRNLPEKKQNVTSAMLSLEVITSCPKYCKAFMNWYFRLGAREQLDPI